MNKPTIEELLLQILSTCLLINAQGKWHAFFDFSGHVGAMYVYLRPSDCTYVPGEDFPLEQHSVQFTSSNRHQISGTEEEARQRLVKALAWTQGYLSMEAAA